MPCASISSLWAALDYIQLSTTTNSGPFSPTNIPDKQTHHEHPPADTNALPHPRSRRKRIIRIRATQAAKDESRPSTTGAARTPTGARARAPTRGTRAAAARSRSGAGAARRARGLRGATPTAGVTISNAGSSGMPISHSRSNSHSRVLGRDTRTRGGTPSRDRARQSTAPAVRRSCTAAPARARPPAAGACTTRWTLATRAVRAGLDIEGLFFLVRDCRAEGGVHLCVELVPQGAGAAAAAAQDEEEGEEGEEDADGVGKGREGRREGREGMDGEIQGKAKGKKTHELLILLLSFAPVPDAETVGTGAETPVAVANGCVYVSLSLAAPTVAVGSGAVGLLPSVAITESPVAESPVGEDAAVAESVAAAVAAAGALTPAAAVAAGAAAPLAFKAGAAPLAVLNLT
ncbi:hypothetical protein K438DRAFT_2066080 [Mycena galopus ATCC 62051]|nr:hypothetical protein K438DRAFT_2066080 [Mycena galopus ATCC 62051]